MSILIKYIPNKILIDNSIFKYINKKVKVAYLGIMDSISNKIYNIYYKILQ